MNASLHPTPTNPLFANRLYKTVATVLILVTCFAVAQPLKAKPVLSSAVQPLAVGCRVCRDEALVAPQMQPIYMISAVYDAEPIVRLAGPR